MSRSFSLSLATCYVCTYGCMHIALDACVPTHLYKCTFSAHRNAHARAHARVCVLIRGDTSHTHAHTHTHTLTHTHTHAHTRKHTCRLHLNPHACACTDIQRSRHSMTAFGTCAGTERHSACVQFIARVCDGHVCALRLSSVVRPSVPQVRRGPTAPPARRGLPELTTRP
jgi:hypothetical protein